MSTFRSASSSSSTAAGVAPTRDAKNGATTRVRFLSAHQLVRTEPSSPLAFTASVAGAGSGDGAGAGAKNAGWLPTPDISAVAFDPPALPSGDTVTSIKVRQSVL